VSGYGQTSGSTAYSPFASELVIDAFERCGIYDLENKHLYSARRSLNLLLASDWSNRSVNLFKVDQQPTAIPMPQGVPSFGVTADCVLMLDTYRRNYQLGAPVSTAPAFATTLNSSSVTCNLANAGVAVGNFVGINIPVSIGGLILFGFYQVASTPSPSQFTFVAGSAATAGAAGGQVPQFTTVNGSSNVTVNLPNHGLLAGEPFVVQVATTVGGLTLYGNYTVQSVTDASHFVISANTNANAGASAFENGGLAQISAQPQGVPSFTDILMTPFSRNDYAAQANKLQQGQPTNYWFQKQTIPQVTIWPVADQNGPYEMQAYFMRQMQTANPSGGQTVDVPPRMIYALQTDLARDLSLKWAVDRYDRLKAEADAAWDRASTSDTEIVSTYIVPQMPSGL
jgi:hypothetical protein